MKKGLAVFLSVALLFAAMVVPNVPSVDAATSATTDPAPAPSTSKPATPAQSNTGSKSSSSSSSSSTSSSTTAGGTYYTVKSGDVFWRIAKMHGLTIAELAKLNPQIKNINLIYPGQKILVKPSTTDTSAVSAKKIYHGIGLVSNYRVRSGNNDNVNITTASALFDEKGRIIEIEWDVLEITPEEFPGWLDPKADDSVKAPYLDAQANGWPWKTKRELGYDYDMTHLKAKGAADNLTKKEWFEQLDFYEEFFKGKTVAEVVAWFNKYTDANGRPFKMAYLDSPNISANDKKAAEEAKARLTADEIKMLVDVTTNATMSLKDPHSDFITSLQKAYNNRKEVKF